MDSFASPSTRGERARLGGLRLLEAGALTLLMGLSFLSVPGRPDTRLDASWQEMLILARDQGMQFGKDVIFTWGPWGFLCSRFHLGSTQAVPILLWQTLGQLLVAFCLVALTVRLPRWRRLAFAGAILAFHWLFLDSVYFVLITLIGIGGLMGRGTPAFRLVLWCLLLGFLSQLKFTYGVISGAAVGCAFLCWIARGAPGRAALVVVAFGLSVLGAWVAAGQNPDNLYPYVRRSLEISSGYGDAMGFDESWPLFLSGAALALLGAVFVWKIWSTLADPTEAPFAALFLGFVLLVMWKESYTRADMVALGGHIFGIFTFAMILGPVLPGLLYPGRRWHPVDAVLPLCMLAIAWFDADYYRQGPRVAWERIYGNVSSLRHLGSLARDWEGDYASARAAATLPAIKAAVGQGTADVYDFNLGTAILGGLRLSARPIFQGYSAYTPSLQGYNLRHYQSSRAPDFILWDRETVDNRYPGLDDAPLVAGLKGHYEALFPEQDVWLFRKTSSLPREPLLRREVLSRTLRLSDEVDLPTSIDHALWLEADPIPTLLGRLRAMAYKPAILNLATTDRLGRRSVWRMLPRLSRAGFILVPTVANGGDVAALLHGESRSWVKSFHFETPAGQEEFWSRVVVRVSALPSLPLRPAPELPWLVQLGIFDHVPLDVTSAEQQQVIEVPEGRALLLHAEGEALLAVPSGARQLSFGFGLRDGAYTGVGHTAGVDFTLDAVWASGRRERLWERFLDPVAQAGDRGTQAAVVRLPAEAPQRLILHTGAGPAKDYRWDWSYLSRVRFGGPGAL